MMKGDGDKWARYRQALKINLDDLDDCLVSQPELFYHVAEGYAMAVSRRDAAKLEFEETYAEEDKRLRERAFKREEKITNDAVRNEILKMPQIKALNQELLETKEAVDKLGALKEAYLQRSYMLKELVAWKLGELQGLGVARGSQSGRAALRDATSELAQQLRRRATVR